jgi:hypothetical protein
MKGECLFGVGDASRPPDPRGHRGPFDDMATDRFSVVYKAVTN